MSAHPPIEPGPVDATVAASAPDVRSFDAPGDPPGQAVPAERGVEAAAVSTPHGSVEPVAALFARQLEVLQAASARLSRAEGSEAVGRAVVEETGRIIDYHNARVYALEPTGDLVPIAFEGRVGAYEKVDLNVLRTRLGVGFTGWVGQHGEPLLVPDANDDPRGATIPGTDDVDESMLVVPMRYDDAVVGVITLSKLGLDQFDGHDLRLLSILADQAATALESARNLARSHALAGELRLLLDVSGELAASLDSHQVGNILARHLATVMGVEECAISRWDRPNDRVASIGYYPPMPFEELTPFFDIGKYPTTKQVLEDQAPVLIDTEDSTADPDEVALLVEAGKRALVMLPLVASGEAMGLVELFSHHPIALDDDRLSLATTIANEAAIALENARLYEEARDLADRDPLTGFFNHRYLHERFGQEAVRARRSHRPLSLLMLDLDDFKLVNDSFGHLLGDDVLRWTADLIRKTLRASDVPARYGGDEFAILLPDIDHEEAFATAARLREAFATSVFSREGRLTVSVGVSIGSATFPADGRTAAELIAVADAGLYRMKRSIRRTEEPQSA